MLALRAAFGQSRAAVKEAIRLFNEAEAEAESKTGVDLTDPIIALAKAAPDIAISDEGERAV